MTLRTAVIGVGHLGRQHARIHAALSAEGVTQFVSVCDLNEETAREAHAKAKEVRGEYVIAVTGEVISRAENQRNPKIPTGDVEVGAEPQAATSISAVACIKRRVILTGS